MYILINSHYILLEKYLLIYIHVVHSAREGGNKMYVLISPHFILFG